MTKISELTSKQGNVNVEGVIKELGEKRTFNKYGRQLIVVNAILDDGSGTIKLTLWNDDADRFREGDSIKITNGYVSEFQGEKQLTSGKFGKIEKVGESKNTSETKNNDEFEESSEGMEEEITEEEY
ncbi:MAG: OB-fold nucleic acid binding domain-containing protein [Candidatus Nanoarchaeia archaeon]|nr:OB-fold nucleic acid binding domain-containing protein [Candidatus Nanoarchaeia archaeon]